MKLLEINWRPGDRQLRQFAAIASIVLPLASWQWGNGSAPAIAVGVGAGLACMAVGWLRPQWLRPIFVALSLVTWPIGLVVSEIMLAVLYFGVFTPIGLLSRLVGRDPLQRRIDRQAASYWGVRASDRPAASYFRQY